MIEFYFSYLINFFIVLNFCCQLYDDVIPSQLLMIFERLVCKMTNYHLADNNNKDSEQNF